MKNGFFFSSITKYDRSSNCIVCIVQVYNFEVLKISSTSDADSLAMFYALIPRK